MPCSTRSRGTPTPRRWPTSGRCALARAHDDLRGADPAATTVTEVSLRWGFAHQGRFAAAYRRRYGVPPSTTLRG
ncbi:helix-turn-helix domain-containing protein [Yinghuangia aomiensis]